MADVLLVNKPSKTEMTQQRQTIVSGNAAADGGDGDDDDEKISVLAVLVTIFRKSIVACRTDHKVKRVSNVEIGWPTDVRHVAHVTFDRFNGFLGLPVEYHPEVPTKPPSASTSVFGVSTKSMQLSYDSRGNSVPTILLLMQQRLYSQGGLQAEGIFRINAENTREEFVRGQLNSGVVAEGVDLHCLAGLIKAWFRELPTGILDSLSPEAMMQCRTEEECAQLVKLLPPTEAELLDWAINLMADVVENESFNKMNARNIAMVFAPNMTQMADPLTALMHAVHVMNFLNFLITKTLRERDQSTATSTSDSHTDSPDETEDNNISASSEGKPIIECKDTEGAYDDEEPSTEVFYDAYENSEEVRRHVYSDEKLCLDNYIPYSSLTSAYPSLDETKGGLRRSGRYKDEFSQTSNSAINKEKSDISNLGITDKLTGIRNLTRIDSKPNQTEAWRQEKCPPNFHW